MAAAKNVRVCVFIVLRCENERFELWPAECRFHTTLVLRHGRTRHISGFIGQTHDGGKQQSVCVVVCMAHSLKAANVFFIVAPCILQFM